MEQNYKGQWCSIINRICQEGFCSECQAYKEWIKKILGKGASANG